MFFIYNYSLYLTFCEYYTYHYHSLPPNCSTIRLRSGDTMSVLSSISPNDLSILANIAAIAIAKDRTPNDINVIGNFITGVASLLLTIAAQQQFLIAEEDKLKQIQDLKNDIKHKKKDLNNLLR